MRIRIAVALAGVALIAGCSGVAEAPKPTAGPEPVIPLTHPHVLRSCPDIPTRHLDLDEAAVERIFRCTADVHDVRGVPNTVQYVTELRGDAGDLLAAYAMADEPRTDGPCTLQLADPLILWLDLGAETITVYAPRDRCGFPQAAAVEALEAAEFDTVFVAREVVR